MNMYPLHGRRGDRVTVRRTLIAVALAAALAVPTAAAATESDPTATVTVTWAMPTPAGGWTTTPTASTATWPQTLATGTECGGWNQEDVWLGRQSAIDAILADGQLTKVGDDAEDHDVVQSWRYVAQPACVVPTTPPEPYDEGDDTPPAVPATPAAASPVYTG